MSILSLAIRRIKSMILRAGVRRTSEQGGRQFVQTTSRSGEPRDGVEHLQDYGLASRPHEGAEGVVLSLAGTECHKVVIAVADRRYRLTGLKTGEVAIYDDLGQSVRLMREGIAIETAQSLTLQAESVDMTADKSFSISAHTVDMCASAINLNAPTVTTTGMVTAAGVVSTPTVALESLTYTGAAGSALTLDAPLNVTKELTIGGIAFSSHEHPETDSVTGPPQGGQ